MSELKRGRGRPKGSTQFDEVKVNDTHRMTPKAHDFITKNKSLLERMARHHYEVQFKMF